MITSTLAASGRFRVEKYRNGQLIEEIPFFDNLIVRSGFAKILSNNGGASLSAVVGTNGTLPRQSNTALGGLVPGPNSCIETNTYRDFLPDEFGRISWRVVYRFRYAPGALGSTGTVSLREIGVMAAGSLICRTLLKDSEGSPITLNLDVATEGIDVVWEYTEYVPEVTQSILRTYHRRADGFVESTTEHTVSILPANFNSVGAPPLGWLPATAGKLVTCNFEQANSRFGHGSVGTIAEAPTFDEFEAPASMTTSLPLGGAAQNIISVGFGLNDANMIDGINCALLSLGHTQWQLSIDPPIMKQDTQELRIEFSMEMENFNVS